MTNKNKKDKKSKKSKKRHLLDSDSDRESYDSDNQVQKSSAKKGN